MTGNRFMRFVFTLTACLILAGQSLAANLPPLSAGQVATAAKPGQTFVPFGDSITAGHWAAISGATLARASNVVTVTFAGHPFMSGQSALVEQMGDASFNGFVIVTRTGPNTFTYPSVGADGATSGGYIRVPYWTADNGWVSWARLLLGNRLSMLYNGGVGGSSSADVAGARFQADVIARHPAWTSVLSGVNDLTTLSAAQIFANLQTGYASARNAGIGVIAMTITPLASGHPSYSVANNQKILDVNYRIRAECLKYPGMICVDSYAAIVDPLSATGQPRTGYLATDKIHPSPLGSYAIAKAFYKAVSYRIPEGNTLISSASDNRGASSANSNLWQWPPSTSSGGTVGGTATGTPPAGFAVSSTAGSPTVVASGPARTVAVDGDDFGTNCRMVFTANAAGDAAKITQSSSGWATSAGVGKAYYLEASINITGVAGSNLSQLYASITFVVDGVNYPGYVLQPSGGTFPTSDIQGVIQSTPFFLTGTTVANIVIALSVAGSAAGTPVTVDLGRVQVRELPAGSIFGF